MQSKLEFLLERKAVQFDKEAEAANALKDRFNTGYFEGKAEQCRLTISALQQVLTGDPQDIIDALNGDL